MNISWYQVVHTSWSITSDPPWTIPRNEHGSATDTSKYVPILGSKTLYWTLRDWHWIRVEWKPYMAQYGSGLTHIWKYWRNKSKIATVLKCAGIEILFAGAPENDSRTIPTHAYKYGLLLNGWSLPRSKSLHIYYYLAHGQLPTTFRPFSIEAFTNAKDHMRSWNCLP